MLNELLNLAPSLFPIILIGDLVDEFLELVLDEHLPLLLDLLVLRVHRRRELHSGDGRRRVSVTPIGINCLES